MATQNFINECKNRANANRLAKFNLPTLVSKNLLKNTNVNGGDNNYWQNFSTFDETTGTLTRSTTTTSESYITHKINGLKSNTTYTISCLAKSNGNVRDMDIYCFNKNTQGIKSKQHISLTTNFQKYEFTFTTSSDVDYSENATIRFDNNGSMASGTEAILTIKDVMLVEGTDTDFVPYDYKEVNQTNYLTKIELKDSCYVNNELIGSIFTKSAEVELLNLPVNTGLVGETITPEIGVRYANDSTEYITFDDYVIESVKDEQTASNTSFSAMNGSTLLDKEYVCSLSFDSGATHTINEFYQDACSQIGLTPTDVTFDNSEIVMTGNPFTNKETIRTVLSEVEKVSCSIAKFDWANETISLTWLSNQIDYEFNTSDYSTLEGSMERYGPLNVIIIANAQLDGENVVMTDEESVAEYGEHQIIIDSPYFLYTEELRTQAIQAIYDKLDGLTYYDLKLTTPYGKPFLNIGDKIRINTNENQVYDTYVLSHTFTYDGTFQSIIESPALTQEEQTIKNEFKGNSVREKLRRTELMVDKTTGEITAIAQRVSEVESKTVDNYTKEEIDELILNVEGVTNKLINSGGNNIFRNTGLWFEDTSNIEYLYPSNTLYPSDELYMLAEPYFEYWQGKVVRMAEDKATNLNALLLQNTTLSQKQQVRNGSYTISFKYKKLIQLSTASVTINGETIGLEEDEGEFVKTIDVTSQYINISFLCDTDNGVEIYDLMGNVGEEKAEYSQHQNETTTDTVNISKGITITSSDTNTTFKANSDGIRVYNSKDLETPMTEFTDTGTDTKKIIVENEATIVEVLFKKVGNNTWLTKL